MKNAYLAVVEESYDVYVVECSFRAIEGKQCVAEDVNFEEAVNIKRAWDKLLEAMGVNEIQHHRQHGYYTTVNKNQVINRL